MPWIWSRSAASEWLLCCRRKQHMGQRCCLWEEISGEVFERLEATLSGWICGSSSRGFMSAYPMPYHGILGQSFWCTVKDPQHKDQHRVSAVMHLIDHQTSICLFLFSAFLLNKEISGHLKMTKKIWLINS
jgi:hypothetical protein